MFKGMFGSMAAVGLAAFTHAVILPLLVLGWILAIILSYYRAKGANEIVLAERAVASRFR